MTATTETLNHQFNRCLTEGLLAEHRGDLKTAWAWHERQQGVREELDQVRRDIAEGREV